MKRLIATIAVTFGFVLALAGSAAAAPARYWKVDIFDPAASTTSRTLNVAYNVFSTTDTDNDFDVTLLQNGSQVGTQHISHDNGNSGAFSISMPTTGTYKYKVVADNNDASETQESAEKTVQVVDGPAPTVTTISSTSSTGGAGGGTSGSTAAAQPGTGSGAVAGATAGDANGDGVVDSTAATTDQNKKDVLGAETAAAAKKSRGWYVSATLLALVVAGVVAYVVQTRRNIS